MNLVWWDCELLMDWDWDWDWDQDLY